MVKVTIREIPYRMISVSTNRTSLGAVRQLWPSTRFATLLLSTKLEKETR
jgi:hypothetical protein